MPLGPNMDCFALEYQPDLSSLADIEMREKMRGARSASIRQALVNKRCGLSELV